MHRLLAIAAIGLLTACESQPVAPPCPPVVTVADCPPDAVYKSPDDAPACGCTEPVGVPVPRGFQPWAEGFQGSMRFVAGDEIQISLPFYDEEDVTTTVAPDGNIYIGLLGAVAAEGRTPAELEAELEARYAQYLRFPEVGVVPSAFGSRLIFVGGEVKTAGAYPLRGPTGVLEAVFEAGGFLDTARREHVILIRRGPNDLPMMKFLNLKSFANDGTPTENTLLQPFDIIVVPKSPIAKINLFIDQYIEGVVPFNHSFSYSLIDLPAAQQ